MIRRESGRVDHMSASEEGRLDRNQHSAFAYVQGLDEGLGTQFEKPGWHSALRDWIAGRLDTLQVDCDVTVIDDEIARIVEAIRLEGCGMYTEQDEPLRRKPR